MQRFGESANRSLVFYVKTLSFKTERGDEFLERKAQFPSVRVNENTILDLMEYDDLCLLLRRLLEVVKSLVDHQ